MNKYYQIAGHVVCCSGDKLCMAVNRIEGFHPFAWQGEEPGVAFTFVEGQEVPDMQEELYPFVYEDVQSSFGRTANGYLLVEKPAAEEAFYMWCDSSRKVVYLSGNWSLRLYRFAMWLGYGLMTLPEQTLAIHSSCIVYQNQAVLFLGESGTGKSTHTRLWREHIEGAVLLNDDSPMLRVEDGKVWVYGSPWSGKTPCYKAERYELKGCVRLSQAPHNRIRKLSILEAYGAIHPSCAPEFAYDDVLYDEVSSTLGQILRTIPIYHLECLPDGDAAHLSSHTIFSC